MKYMVPGKVFFHSDDTRRWTLTSRTKNWR